METITLEKLEKAFEIKDPGLAKMFVSLVATDPKPKKPVKEGCLTYQSFLRELNMRKRKVDRDHFRQENLKILEAESEYFPERLKVDKLLMQLWQENSSYSRMCLFEIIAKVPLVWGPWRALKQIFKEAESKNDTEIFGALCARFDCEFASFSGRSEVSKATLRYLVRRGWRYLRQTGQSLSSCYLDYVADVLKFYPQSTNWRGTWIANHIFFHNSGKYTRRKFHSYFKQNFLGDRAFADLWRRSPRPLFNLLEEAKSDYVCKLVISALKKDFVTDLREIEAIWIIRLLQAKREILDEFAVWLLTTIPKFEQSAFRELHLHKPVLDLLHSSSLAANQYACKYARTYARDLPIDDLLLLADHDNKDVNKLVIDLLKDRHPRNDIGLEAWGRMLEFEACNAFASKMLREHFGAKELTTEWFKERLLDDSYYSLQFVEKNLLEVHSLKSLGVDFFCDMFLEEKLGYDAVDFCLKMLGKFDKKHIDIEFIKVQLLNPASRFDILQWLIEEKVKPESLGVEYLKALSYHVEWEKSPWVQNLKDSELQWRKELEFDEGLVYSAQEWLSDVRKFSASDIGFEWLFELVQRKEQNYHDFASEYLSKAFVPADFAAKKVEKKAPKKTSKKTQTNLKEQTFLFTGKLKTMTRGEATKKVTGANGKNASGVSAKLDYLVIGDEGSSLYGEGRKGSKQVKAEKLIEGGAETKIISETAFLQMLAGKTSEHSSADSSAGCEVIWQYLFSGKDEDSPLARFAKSYIERHHPHISLKLTDRPVDPGAEIPESFLTFERLQQLVTHERQSLRSLGLDLLYWELARLQPDIYEIVKICEQSDADVTAFFTRALTAEDTKEHRTYRLDPTILKADAVYQLCESPQEQARALGMRLIHLNPHLAIPEELFRLTESTDRRVLSFVVEIMWKLYYEKGTTVTYAPSTDKEVSIKQRTLRDKSQNLPAAEDMLNDFLRRMLFRISPAKFAKDAPADDNVSYTSFRKVKLRIIEVMRDIALKNKEFARLIVPLFEEFAASHGQSEKSACLVALARIGHVFDEFQVLVKG
ncbi:BRCT domain-containing protein [Candidatus Uabimicrobium amorphum]|uniref:DNA ligase n=1 Tax=Uabimicrobium amorphum TaxID=2596890 RepID=A0A5S9IQ17_UABAM|nr:BRCT domain-containing protein [Candidatus Uabimicrobium amorphum]BBM84585.1 DNA ligase [Candidatus Uabimicrobium amorphum]